MILSKTFIIAGLSMIVLTSCAADKDAALSNTDTNTNTEYSKPGAAIRFKSTYDGKSNAGEVEKFTLTINDGYDVGDLKIRLAAPEGMKIFTPVEALFSMAGDNDHEIEVNFQVFEEGRHYIRIYATADLGNGQVYPATHSMGVYVGKEAQSKKYKTDSTEEASSENKIIEMDAVETIIEAPN